MQELKTEEEDLETLYFSPYYHTQWSSHIMKWVRKLKQVRRAWDLSMVNSNHFCV